ncbi:MAG: polysaccharide biosynthesis/export family protein [Verrucomicrobiota bacterium]
MQTVKKAHQRIDINPGRRFLFLGSICAALTHFVGCSTTSTSNENTQYHSQESPIFQSTQSLANREKSDRIRIGDIMSINLTGVPAQDARTFEVRVDEAGNVSMPFIGSVRAAGSTAATLKENIETRYKTGGFYATPNIQIVVREIRYVSVGGEVRVPQRLQYTQDLTAASAIAGAGGFTDYANQREVKLLRGGKVFIFNAREITSDPSLDIALEPDDKIQIDRSIF